MTTTASPLYPLSAPYNSFTLPVGTADLHVLSVRQYGNPSGLPVFFIHGGPGGGCDHTDAQLFDPKLYRIILHDQRGSGLSTPSSCLVENTTAHLIADIEALRAHLQIDKMHLFGGSWGSTLVLAYAQAFPQRCCCLVLRGIFTLRKLELDWFYQGPGAGLIFPEYWEGFLAPIPVEERDDMVRAYYARLTGDDEVVRAAAGQAWSQWEMATSRLQVDAAYIARSNEPGFADTFARIESHYFVNEGFMPQGALLLKENIDKIRGIPTVIVQGRYDLVCPMKTAWELHLAFPEAKFVVIPDAGHSAIEKGIQKALVEATDEFAKLK